MANSFSYSVRTTLERERVWELLQDIQNWIKVSDVYNNAEWSGIPWVPGSCITGRLKYPLEISFRYVLERYEPPVMISYLAHSLEAGFATHRTVERKIKSPKPSSGDCVNRLAQVPLCKSRTTGRQTDGSTG